MPPENKVLSSETTAKVFANAASPLKGFSFSSGDGVTAASSDDSINNVVPQIWGRGSPSHYSRP